jgi:hypothetical protein
VAYTRHYQYAKNNPSIFYAPFRNDLTYNLGEVMTSRLTKDEDNVYAGFHSFKNYADAHHLAYVNGWNYKNRRFHVMKAYIPKGSKYYEGTFYGKASYASSKMMIVRPLGFWERLLLRWKSW